MAEARLDLLLDFVERSRKRLLVAGVIALGLHLPFTPAMPLFRVLERMMLLREDQSVKQEEPVPPQQVEVELKELARQEEAKKFEEQKQDKNANSLSLSKPAPTPPTGVKFAQGQNQPASEQKAENPASPPPPPEKKRPKEIGLDGKLSQDLAGKPGVTLGLWFTSFRDHPLGASVGQLLACDPQWNAFLQQGVDPTRHFEGALVVGPSIKEPKKMTAAIRHNLPPEQVKSVMGALVEQSGPQGRWLRPDVANARVGKTPRVLFPHSQDTFFVTPPKGWETLHDVTEPLRVPSADGRSLSLTIRRPSNALSRFGVTLPARLRELRLEVFANVDHSVDVKLELDDASEAAAQADVRKVSSQLRNLFADLWATTEAVRALTGLAMGRDQRAQPAPTLDLVAEQKTLVGNLHFSAGQAKTTLELLTSVACKKGKRPPAAVPASP
jgi:hypothetical protein